MSRRRADSMNRTGWAAGVACWCMLSVGADCAYGQAAGSVVGWGNQVIADRSKLSDLVRVAGGVSPS